MDNLIAFSNTADDTNLGIDEERETAVPITARNGDPGCIAFTMRTRDGEPLIAQTLKGEGFDSSDDGTRQTLVVVDVKQITSPVHRNDGLDGNAPSISSNASRLLAFSCKDGGADAGEVAPTLRAMEFKSSHMNGGGQIAVASTHCVRRLTPTECEALQSFPRDFTLVPVRTTKNGKVVMAADSPRYRALGNSMNTEVVRAIGKRLKLVNELMDEMNKSGAA